MPLQTVLTGTDYLSVQDVERITARIAKDHHVSSDHATKILNGTIEFLKLSAQYPKQRFVPSEEIDIGWHTLLLYTRVYRQLCQKLGANFIDHEPSDGDIRVPKGGSAKTVEFMQKNEIIYDHDLWPERNINDCQADPCNCTGDGYTSQIATA